MLSTQWFTIQGLAWSPDGKEVWFTASKSGTDRTLYATTLDGKQRVVARLPGALMLLDIAKDGRVLLVRATWRRELLGLVDGEPKQRELSWLDYTYPSDLSADGKTLLFDEEGGGGALAYSKSGGLTYAVYIRKTDGSPAVLLGEGGAVALSPDGKWAIAQTQESPSQFRLLPTGAGEPRDITKDNVNHSWAHWFPDGKRILFSADEPGKGVRFYVYELASGKSQLGLESTILDLSGPEAILLRPGAVTVEEIEEAIGPITLSEGNPDRPNAPGQLRRHYAPATKLRLNAAMADPGEALLAFGPNPFAARHAVKVLNLSDSGDLNEAAANLFSMLRTLDGGGYHSIAVMTIPASGLGIAINDRLARAAAPPDGDADG